MALPKQITASTPILTNNNKKIRKVHQGWEVKRDWEIELRIKMVAKHH